MMENFFARLRACCGRCAVTAGKWLLTIFVGVAAFALAAQALAMLFAALALLLAALCLASLCMPEESRAVWAWMRETLGGWSRVAGTGKNSSGAEPEGCARNADSVPECGAETPNPAPARSDGPRVEDAASELSGMPWVRPGQASTNGQPAGTGPSA